MLARLGLRIESLLLLLAMIALVMIFTVRIAHAETTRHTRTTTTTTVESDDDGQDAGYAPPADAIPAPKNMKPPGAPAMTETTMSQVFGSKAVTGMAGCKTEALSKDVIKDLKKECAAWVKEQKADLGKNYLGNTCEDSCDDCDMSLVRCKVTGTIRYRKSSNAPEEDVE